MSGARSARALFNGAAIRSASAFNPPRCSHLQAFYPLSCKFTSATATNFRMSRPDITLYTAQTPNGIKISIALEELGWVFLSFFLFFFFLLYWIILLASLIIDRLTDMLYSLPYKVENIDIKNNTQKEPYVITLYPHLLR